MADTNINNLKNNITEPFETSNNMPTELPSDVFPTMEKPDVLAPLDLSALYQDIDTYGDTLGYKAKTAEELDAMFPKQNFTGEKWMAVAKAGLALMQPTLGGQIAPAISNAGTQLLNDASAVRAAERQSNAANRAGRLSIQQQEEATAIQLRGQALGMNRDLLMTELKTNYEARAKQNANMWEAYTTMLTNNQEEALKFGIEKYKTKPVTFRHKVNGVEVENAGFLVNGQYYYPSDTKDAASGDWNYNLVEDASSVIPISSTTQAINTMSKDKKLFAENYSTIQNIGKNLYSLGIIRKSIDPNLGGDATRASVTGLVKSKLQKWTTITSDFTKNFFKDNPYDGYNGETVWISDMADIIIEDQTGAFDDKQKAQFGMVRGLLDNLEGTGLAFIENDSGNMDIFEGDTAAERQEMKNLIWGRLKFDTQLPENEARIQAIIYALARARKSSGRLNLDDIERAAQTLNIYNDSAPAIVKKLETVEDELKVVYQTQLDIFKRNFPQDAERIANERGTTLDYSDEYWNDFFGNSVTPKKQNLKSIWDPDMNNGTGGWKFEVMN